MAAPAASPRRPEHTSSVPHYRCEVCGGGGGGDDDANDVLLHVNCTSAILTAMTALLYKKTVRTHLRCVTTTFCENVMSSFGFAAVVYENIVPHMHFFDVFALTHTCHALRNHIDVYSEYWIDTFARLFYERLERRWINNAVAKRLLLTFLQKVCWSCLTMVPGDLFLVCNKSDRAPVRPGSTFPMMHVLCRKCADITQSYYPITQDIRERGVLLRDVVHYIIATQAKFSPMPFNDPQFFFIRSELAVAKQIIKCRFNIVIMDDDTDAVDNDVQLQRRKRRRRRRRSDRSVAIQSPMVKLPDVAYMFRAHSDALQVLMNRDTGKPRADIVVFQPLCWECGCTLGEREASRCCLNLCETDCLSFSFACIVHDDARRAAAYHANFYGGRAPRHI